MSVSLGRGRQVGLGAARARARRRGALHGAGGGRRARRCAAQTCGSRTYGSIAQFRRADLRGAVYTTPRMFDIGSSLREARLRQELDFPELEERTKIRPKYLRALEDERFDILPAPTYVKGFLRSYAEALGLDGQPFVDEYNSRFAVGEDERAVRARRVRPVHAARPAGRASRAWRWSRCSRSRSLTALVIAAWKFGGPEGEKVPGLATQGRRRPSTAGAGAAARRRPRRAGGRSGAPWMEVRAGSSGGQAPVQRDARARVSARPSRAERLQLALAEPENVVVRRERQPGGAARRHRRSSSPRSGSLAATS